MTAVQPLFSNGSTAVVTIHNCMGVINKAVNMVDLGEVSIITADQTLYAIAHKNTVAVERISM